MFLILFGIWIILNGRADGDVLLSGAVLAAFVYIVLARFTGLTMRKEVKNCRLLPRAVAYCFLLFWEILKANLAVAGLILRGQKPQGGLVSFHSGLKTNMGNALLANSITLTPGTITLRQEGDEFLVHALIPAYGEGMADSSFVRAIAKMEELWNR